MESFRVFFNQSVSRLRANCAMCLYRLKRLNLILSALSAVVTLSLRTLLCKLRTSRCKA